MGSGGRGVAWRGVEHSWAGTAEWAQSGVGVGVPGEGRGDGRVSRTLGCSSPLMTCVLAVSKKVSLQIDGALARYPPPPCACQEHLELTFPCFEPPHCRLHTDLHKHANSPDAHTITLVCLSARSHSSELLESSQPPIPRLRTPFVTVVCLYIDQCAAVSLQHLFCFCSLLKNQTVPKERHTPHGGSDKSTTRNFGDHLY